MSLIPGSESLEVPKQVFRSVSQYMLSCREWLILFRLASHTQASTSPTLQSSMITLLHLCFQEVLVAGNPSSARFKSLVVWWLAVVLRLFYLCSIPQPQYLCLHHVAVGFIYSIQGPGMISERSNLSETSMLYPSQV